MGFGKDIVSETLAEDRSRIKVPPEPKPALLSVRFWMEFAPPGLKYPAASWSSLIAKLEPIVATVPLNPVVPEVKTLPVLEKLPPMWIVPDCE